MLNFFFIGNPLLLKINPRKISCIDIFLFDNFVYTVKIKLGKPLKGKILNYMIYSK